MIADGFFYVMCSNDIEVTDNVEKNSNIASIIDDRIVFSRVVDIVKSETLVYSYECTEYRCEISDIYDSVPTDYVYVPNSIVEEYRGVILDEIVGRLVGYVYRFCKWNSELHALSIHFRHTHKSEIVQFFEELGFRRIVSRGVVYYRPVDTYYQLIQDLFTTNRFKNIYSWIANSSERFLREFLRAIVQTSRTGGAVFLHASCLRDAYLISLALRRFRIASLLYKKHRFAYSLAISHIDARERLNISTAHNKRLCNTRDSRLLVKRRESKYRTARQYVLSDTDTILVSAIYHSKT